MEESTLPEIINIFKLPEEILEIIVSYVDTKSRKELATVCKYFYEILCRLERDQHPLKFNYTSILNYDETIFQSIIHSKREFCGLSIALDVADRSGINRLLQIVQKFGPRLKKFKIWARASISYEHLMMLLQYVPKMEELILDGINVVSGNLLREELTLPKLKKLNIRRCRFETPAILNNIPANVLHELIFTKSGSFQSFLNRQKNIRKLEITNNDLIRLNQISMDHLQLEHLKINSGVDVIAIVSQQPNLRYLDFKIDRPLNDKDFAAVTKLAYLEVLRIRCRSGILSHTFKSNQSLLKLKEFRLEDDFPDDDAKLFDLSKIKCNELRKLKLIHVRMEIRPEVFAQMGLNFHSLRVLDIVNSPLKILGSILEHIPLLESIKLASTGNDDAPDDVMIVYEHKRHEYLKQIVVVNNSWKLFQNTQALLKIIQACPNLEKIWLDCLRNFTALDCRNIVEHHDNLTHLSLGWWPENHINFSFDSFSSFQLTDAVIDFGRMSKKLVFVRFFSSNTNQDYDRVRLILKQKFLDIKMMLEAHYKPFYNPYAGFIRMKKGNIPEWNPSDELFN